MVSLYACCCFFVVFWSTLDYLKFPNLVHFYLLTLQAFDLLQISLRDPSEKVQRSALQVFLPSFAAWAYELGRLEHQLVHAMLRDLEDLVKAIYICSGVGFLLTWSAGSWDACLHDRQRGRF